MNVLELFVYDDTENLLQKLNEEMKKDCPRSQRVNDILAYLHYKLIAIPPLERPYFIDQFEDLMQKYKRPVTDEEDKLYKRILELYPEDPIPPT